MRSIFAVLLAIAVLPACTKEADSKLAEARAQAEKALDSMKGAVAAQGGDARKQLDSRLTALTAKIEKLQREASRMHGTAKEQAQAKVAELEKARKEIVKQLHEADEEGSGAWDAAKSGVTKALDNLESAYEDVREKLE
jgi:TolA-binding protein